MVDKNNVLDRFASEVKRVINYFRQEEDMSYSGLIGVLFQITMEIVFESFEKDEKEE